MRAAEGSTGSFGDLRFHASAVAFRHGPKEARADFTIQIPYREIKFIPEKDRFSAKLRKLGLREETIGYGPTKEKWESVTAQLPKLS